MIALQEENKNPKKRTILVTESQLRKMFVEGRGYIEGSYKVARYIYARITDILDEKLEGMDRAQVDSLFKDFWNDSIWQGYIDGDDNHGMLEYNGWTISEDIYIDLIVENPKSKGGYDMNSLVMGEGKAVYFVLNINAVPFYYDEPEDTLDTIAHELQHAYRDIKMRLSTGHEAYYTQFSNKDDSSNAYYSWVSGLAYAINKDEIASRVNGLYSYLKEKGLTNREEIFDEIELLGISDKLYNIEDALRILMQDSDEAEQRTIAIMTISQKNPGFFPDAHGRNWKSYKNRLCKFLKDRIAYYKKSILNIVGKYLSDIQNQ